MTAEDEWKDVPANGAADLTADAWSFTFENLPKGYEYRAVEVSMKYGENTLLLKEDARSAASS